MVSSASGSSSSSTTTASIPWATAFSAYNDVVLSPPPLPVPLPPTQFSISLANQAVDVSGLSIPQSGSFYGFSIEMSVANQVIGKNSSLLQVPFLNLMAIISERGGSVRVRVGGNTQETATLVSNLSIPGIIEQDSKDPTDPTGTPIVDFTPDLLYMLGNVSALVNVKWYLGIPLNDTANLRLEIAEYAEAILGDNVLGFQVGNEPDLYASHGHRPATYGPFDYFGEFGVVVDAINNDPKIPVRNNLIGPSVSGNWKPEDVWNTGFIPQYNSSLGMLSVEHYPDQNCAAAFPNAGFGPPKDAQAEFPTYLTHASGQGVVQAYINSTLIAQAAEKPFIMFETNTASCGGFPGISDSFGAAIWALDYGLQMAYTNFSGALLHVGGHNVSYNPFTPPPTNISRTEGWTIGPIFYSVVAMAEALGSSNTSRVLDLNANTANPYTPAYAIYENGVLARLVLFNYMTDPSGAAAYTATISVGGGLIAGANRGGLQGEPNGTPAQVNVKYLLAPSVSEKNNVTWAGQTLGGRFQADGRWQGSEQVVTIPCNQAANTCDIPESTPSSTQTFPTTTQTKTVATFSVDSSVLATSNGDNGSSRNHDGLTSTSKGSSDASRAAGLAPGITALAGVLAGVWVLIGGLRR
ncbi:Beta-glucuronidase [Grifola frondosa]|uniref:Beta-glucuronidase n=1 Tax=Grifola frondosa TaxID=5627 RepID=A0A1C7LXY3_GRIFR|nr:Beta-glucuronidase [Grifola frondosa]